MNRVIKFRGKQGAVWWYGNLIQVEGGGCGIKYKPGQVTPVNANTVGQFTGLLDKNGKEIWEGDIQDCGEFTDGSGRCLYVASWDEEHASFVSSSLRKGEPYRGQSQVDDSPIIGNIYENKDLLV